MLLLEKNLRSDLVRLLFNYFLWTKQRKDGSGNLSNLLRINVLQSLALKRNFMYILFLMLHASKHELFFCMFERRLRKSRNK